MFVLNSYYCTTNLSEWNDQLKRLTARIQKEKKGKYSKKSRVLLLGSPIYFPNYKVPFLIEEVGLEVYSQIDYTTLSIQEIDRKKQIQKADFISDFYKEDCSPAYVRNSMTVYALTQTGEVSVTKGSENPIRQNSLGHFIAVLSAENQDIDGDGVLEEVHDYARADFGQNAFKPAPTEIFDKRNSV